MVSGKGVGENSSFPRGGEQTKSLRTERVSKNEDSSTVYCEDLHLLLTNDKNIGTIRFMLNSLEKKSLWKTHKKELIILFLGILFGTFVLLLAFDAVPLELQFGPNTPAEQKTPVESNLKAILPNHIKISKIGVDVSISNPESDNVEILDEYLKKGSVRYPGSGSLAGGNMFLFAHSTGFKIVQNQAYKAFNDLKSLSAGDVITISGEDGKIYVYKVSSVKLATDKDVLVRFDKTDQMLTLSTCNTFGEKSERYVVEAYFDSIQ